MRGDGCSPLKTDVPLPLFCLKPQLWLELRDNEHYQALGCIFYTCQKITVIQAAFSLDTCTTWF